MTDGKKLVVVAVLAAAVAIAAQLFGVPLGGPPPASTTMIQEVS